MKKICVMGVGNVLMGDDALGPWVLKSLESAFRFPPEVALLDAGAAGLDLTTYLDGVDALVVIDALRAPGVAGEVRWYRKQRLLAGAVPVLTSPHEPSLREALLRLRLLGRCPEDVLLVGAVPLTVSTGVGLSACVRQAVPVIEAYVLLELDRLGARPTMWPHPAPPDPWWERKPACAWESPAR